MRYSVVAASMLFAATSSTAATLVDTGPAAGGPAWVLINDQWLAGEFSLATAATVTSVEGYSIATGDPDIPGFGNGGTLTAVIYASDGVSTTPGAELFSAAFTGRGPDSFGWMGPSGLSWALGPGTYWVSFEVRAGQTYSGVLGGNSPSPLAREIYLLGGDWVSFPLNNGWRIMGDTGARGVIPEPATWAMLIAGFGLVGGALRRRRLAAA